MKLSYLVGIGALVSIAFVCLPASAALELPNYAQGGNLKQELQSKGGAITDILMIVAVMVGIGGIVVGGIKMPGDSEAGKRWIVNSVGGLIVASVAYGLAQLVV